MNINVFFQKIFVFLTLSMESTPEVKSFIRKHSSLFWYTSKDKVENISLDFLVEQVLNYGDTETIRELFAVVGLKNVKQILESTKDRKQGNYFPEIYNYFLKYTLRHAS